MVGASSQRSSRSIISALVITILLPAAALLLDLVFRPIAADAAAPQDPAALIRTALQTPDNPVVDGIALDRRLLTEVYQARNFAPIWAAVPAMTTSFVEALRAAESEGIAPDQSGANAVGVALADPAVTETERELLLTDRYLAYTRVLTQGAVAPADFEADWAVPRPSFDPVQAVAAMSQQADLGPVLSAMAPSSPQYGALKDALQRYRTMDAGGGWQALASGPSREPGMVGPSILALRERLAAEGDLPTAGADTYDPTVTAAVRHFQARHGLTEDGRVGTATLRALNVAASDRIEQIGLNLERLRSLPHTSPATRIEVNVAAATLTLYREGRPVLTSRVIVGAPRHPTPVFTAEAVAVLLNPPWNVPSSIVRNELQPAMRRSPDYLARNHLALLGPGVVDPQGRDIDWRSTTVLGRGWRVQQAPGSWNALGRIKLELPNPFDVYLHDTPAKALFALPVRALSHGCIRVEAVHQLAETLLGRPGDMIDQAIDAGATLRLPLPSSVPVELLYLTAFVDPDGTVEFRDDIYGRDGRLAAALAKRKSGQKPLAVPGPSASIACSVG